LTIKGSCTLSLLKIFLCTCSALKAVACMW